jgi:ABC-2 type transport system permease protein
MNRFAMLLRREYWEHKGGFFWAPLWTAVVFVLITLGGIFTALWHTSGKANGGIHIGVPLKKLLQRIPPEEYSKIGMGLDTGMAGFWSILQMILFFVLFFYLLGSLYDERKDRSVLFWKSLPVSDLSTVLSKVATAAIVAPLLSLAITIALNIVFLLIVSAFVAFNGVNPLTVVWGPAEPLSLWAKMAAMVPLNAIWALPAIGWLMFTSAFAKSKPFLWAILLPVGVGVLINWFEILETIQMPDTWYWQHVAGRMLGSLVPGSWMWGLEGTHPASFDFDRNGPIELISWSVMGRVLASANLWIGAAVGVALISASIWFRRYRELAD